MTKSYSKTNVAILASGNGTNAENIIKYFKDNANINIALIITNRKDAKVIKRAENHNKPVKVIETDQWNKPEIVLNVFKKYNIDFIVLAGFMILVPAFLIKEYPGRIINIHPALLPDFGGKAMYGNKVHKAVINENKKESGITIHYANEKYDDGNIIFQTSCKVPENATPESLAEKIHQLEYEYYPKVIECLIKGDIK